MRGWTLILRLVGQWNTMQNAVTTSMSTFQTEITTLRDEMYGDLNALSFEVEAPKVTKKSRTKKQNS